MPYIEDITCPLVDTNFIFECSTPYLKSEKKFCFLIYIKYSVYYINTLMTTFLTIF